MYYRIVHTRLIHGSDLHITYMSYTWFRHVCTRLCQVGRIPDGICAFKFQHLESLPVVCTEFIPVCTSMYHAIVWYRYTDINRYVPGTFFLHHVCTEYILSPSNMYWYVPSTYTVRTGIKCMFSGTYFRLKVCTRYILQGHKMVCTCMYRVHTGI